MKTYNYLIIKSEPLECVLLRVKLQVCSFTFDFTRFVQLVELRSKQK